MSKTLRFKDDLGHDFPNWQQLTFTSCFEFLPHKSAQAEVACKKLKSSVACLKCKDILSSSQEVAFISQDDQDNATDTFLSDDTSGLNNGDIVFASFVPLNQRAKAVEVKLLDESCELVAGKNTIACHAKQEFAPGYLGYYLNSDKYQQQLNSPDQDFGHGYFIRKKAIASTVIDKPCLAEQEKIAALLDTVSTKLRNLENIAALLKLVASSIEQKLFSQELRCSVNSNIDWQQKQFLECFEPVVKASDKANVQVGDVVFSNYTRDSKLATVIESCDSQYNKTYYSVFRPKQEFAQGFLAYYLNSQEFTKQLSKSYGNSFRIVSSSSIRSTMLNIPCLEEQQQIVAILGTITRKIELNNKQIDLVKNLKQALMQQLFD